MEACYSLSYNADTAAERRVQHTHCGQLTRCPVMCDNAVDGTKPTLRYSIRVVSGYQQNTTLAVQHNPHQNPEDISVVGELFALQNPPQDLKFAATRTAQRAKVRVCVYKNQISDKLQIMTGWTLLFKVALHHPL